MSIRSVLIAGMHNEDNQYVVFCEDLLLKWEHLAELRGGRIPMNHDAAIIVVAQASKEIIHEVASAYEGMGKPVFKTRVGVSEFRQKLEVDIFGSEENIRILRRPIDDPDSISLQDRVWWALSRVLRPGDELRLKALHRFAEKFVIKGHEKAIANTWYRGREEGVFKETRKKGHSIYLGIPPVIAEKILNFNLPLEDESMTVIVRPKAKLVDDAAVHRLEKLFKPAPVPEPEPEELEEEEEEELKFVAPVQSSAETEAMMQLLLDAMAQTQADIKSLRDFINERIPTMLRDEMRGVNSVVKSIQPKLAELNPDQLHNIDQMIDLMIAMGGGRK